MDRLKISDSTKWIANIVAYATAIGVPLMGYLLKIEILVNFGVAIMVLWSLLIAFGLTITALAMALAYFMNDNADALDLYESLAARNALYYTTRVLSVVVAVVYIAIGYPLCGAYLLLCAWLGHWLHAKAAVQYEERKKKV